MLKGFVRKPVSACGSTMVTTAATICALAQRVADDEVCIMGSKSELLRTPVAASSLQRVALGVHGSILKWRTRRDSNAGPSPSEGDALSS